MRETGQLQPSNFSWTYLDEVDSDWETRIMGKFSEEEVGKMNVYQAVAIKTDDDGERTEILQHELLLAKTEQKARDKFVQQLGNEYEAGSDDIELTTFL